MPPGSRVSACGHLGPDGIRLRASLPIASCLATSKQTPCPCPSRQPSMSLDIANVPWEHHHPTPTPRTAKTSWLCLLARKSLLFPSGSFASSERIGVWHSQHWPDPEFRLFIYLFSSVVVGVEDDGAPGHLPHSTPPGSSRKTSAQDPVPGGSISEARAEDMTHWDHQNTMFSDAPFPAF